VAAVWLAWAAEQNAGDDRLGSLMETALAHWDAARMVAFLRWWRSLPC
jgi:hypothetical protein